MENVEEEAPQLAITSLSASKNKEKDSGSVFLPELRRKNRRASDGNEASESSADGTLQSDAAGSAIKKEDENAVIDPTLDPILMSRQRPRVVVSPELLKEIWDENSEFLIRKHLFDVDYFNFMWSLVNLVQPKKRELSKVEVELAKMRERVR